MASKPSSALKALYKTECRTACAKYSYWWSYKAAMVASQRWDLSQCVKKCVHDTIEAERPMFCNGKTKQLDTPIANMK